MGKGIIRFHSDPGYRAVVTVDSNISQYVKLESRGNTLRIETLRKISTDYTVDVYAPSLSDLTINGMGHVKLIDTMTVPSFRMDVSGYGKLEGTIECDKFSTKIAGAGEIKIAGTGEEADINVFGAGTFEGREFKIGKAHISIEGAGNVKTWVVDTLKAEISGVGNIKYRGDPKIEFSRGGLGNLS
ncbi:MAG: DUF2807 domain-containing protein, partial [Treponema sp.]|nr:DUF2807 domain-containing protein [Treponema sp.]